LQPGLQQVLVVAVAQGAQGHVNCVVVEQFRILVKENILVYG